jgi:hypothetical protein
MIEPSKFKSNRQSCVVQNFGENNPENVYFVIRQEGLGRGLFSLLSAVICYLDFADRCGFIPVVDFENFKTEYNEKEVINGTRNSFNYFFQPLNQVSLFDVYTSKRVIFSNNHFPDGYDFNITNLPCLRNTFNKYIKFNPEIEDSIFIKTNSASKILGVHFRGQEMRTAKLHPFPPTKIQILTSINMLMKKGDFNNIFVVTEDLRLLEFIKKEYGEIVLSNNHFRTDGINAYKITPRHNHKYLLGREILVDMLCLSRCNALVCGDSNVTEMARFINNGSYEKTIFIDNGINSRYYPIARFLWRIKNGLHPKLGGFSLCQNSIIYKENNFE